MRGILFFSTAVDSRSIMENKLKDYMNAWKCLKGDRRDHFGISLAGEICHTLAERDAYEDLESFIRNEMTLTSDNGTENLVYLQSEKFTTSCVKLATHLKDFDSAFKLIEVLCAVRNFYVSNSSIN